MNIQSKDRVYYLPSPGSIKNQCGLSHQDIQSHVQKWCVTLHPPLSNRRSISPTSIDLPFFVQREKSCEIFPDPYVGSWHFLHPAVVEQPQYHETISRLKLGQKMHDPRCGSAQDSRQAKVGCAPVSNVYGVDVEQKLIERGFELFRDEERLREQFLATDILAEHAHLDHLDGCIDIL